MSRTRIEFLVFFATLSFLSGFLGFGVVIPSVLMGVGIAIDVLLATTAQFRDEGLSFTSWTLPIMATHIGLPALGYYVFWGLSQEYPELNLILGLFGAFLVLLFIHEIFCEWIDSEPFFGISDWMSKKVGFEEDDVRHFVAIMAVSWDALWSGPAKAAQADAGKWNSFEVAVSFIIAGLVVAFVAHMSLKLAFKLRHVKYGNANQMTSLTMLGKFIITVVIGGFGILSLMRGFEVGNISQATAISFVIMSIFFGIYNKRLYAGTLSETEEAIEGDSEEKVLSVES